MNSRFRSGTLERDFHVLFGEKAQWKWPFFDGDFISSIFSLGVTTFLASIFIGIFVHFDLHGNGFVALAAIIFVWETFRLNWEYVRDGSLRNKLRRKYLPIVEHTEAYELLEEAVAARKKGIVEGIDSKEETEAELIRLWKAAFAEADSLSTPLSPTGKVSDPLDAEPIGDQISRYFEERSSAYQEINQ